MAESPSTLESIRKWVVKHKLCTIGCFWLSGIGSLIAYNWSRPNMKISIKIIHARHQGIVSLGSEVAAFGSTAMVHHSTGQYSLPSTPNSFAPAGGIILDGYEK